jgi:circadian clock protein KaiC
MVRDVEGIGERNRGVFVIKSRGMKHSNQVREFIITDEGIKLLDINIGPTGILTGSSRLAYQLEQREKALSKQSDIEKKKRELSRKRKILESKIANLYTEFESVEEELTIRNEREKLQQKLSELTNGSETPSSGHSSSGTKNKKGKK